MVIESYKPLEWAEIYKNLNEVKKDVIEKTLDEIRGESWEVLFEDIFLDGVHNSYEYLNKIVKLSKTDNLDVAKLLKENPEASMMAEFVLLYKLGIFKWVENATLTETDDWPGILIQSNNKDQIISFSNQKALTNAIAQFQESKWITWEKKWKVWPQTLNSLLIQYNKKIITPEK